MYKSVSQLCVLNAKSRIFSSEKQIDISLWKRQATGHWRTVWCQHLNKILSSTLTRETDCFIRAFRNYSMIPKFISEIICFSLMAATKIPPLPQKVFSVSFPSQKVWKHLSKLSNTIYSNLCISGSRWKTLKKNNLKRHLLYKWKSSVQIGLSIKTNAIDLHSDRRINSH